ncbi:glycosyltransferase family 10 domain-containing protein [Fusobacterium mortiferum]|uniref:glycosyltransferase family 10 domain-containing protein n=1 Tax=Fusobacterium mortiferum TaxID=850 RepID=UPI0022E45604|nr:glycosyltransferase family 10 [Fusobacterium mortiferum]
MKKIKINFVDFVKQFNIMESDFYKILSKKYEIEVSDEPDFLFCSVFGKKNLEYNCIKIFFTGENIVPDFNLYDYAIGFSHLEFEKRYLRLPLYALFSYKKFFKLSLNVHKEKIKKRDKFCNFIYSNGNADKRREEFYNLLSQYKKIDSGGRYLNNIGGPVEDKFSFQQQYKFSIAFENSSDIGYTTEKLIQAKAAGTIPIYWGNPKIAKEFNTKSFINCHNYNNFEEVIEEIKKIDNDDELYFKYLKEPFSYNETMLEEYEKKLENFLYSIVENNQKMRSDSQAVKLYASDSLKYKNLRENKFVKPYLKLLRKLKLIKEI